ncbi:Hypothetical predicted protein, partial [Paramuricea clavata]
NLEKRRLNSAFNFLHWILLFPDITLAPSKDCDNGPSTEISNSAKINTVPSAIMEKYSFQTTTAYEIAYKIITMGLTMGSPVSVVVAQIVMQRLEERALSSHPNPPPFWFCYVDDTLTSVDKHQKNDFLAKNDFLDHLNKQNPSLQFTMEPEKDGKIAFLDCITLVKRAHAVCSSSETVEDELQHLDKVFTINKYSKPFVNNVIEHSRKTIPTTDETERKKTIATIPYIKGTSERIARILRPFNISVAHKPTVTLRNTLTKVKDPTNTKTRIGTVYKVTCAECPATYFGETGRTLDCRIKEHKRSTEKQDVANRIAVHHMETNHRIDCEGATSLVGSTDRIFRLTVGPRAQFFSSGPPSRCQLSKPTYYLMTRIRLIRCRMELSTLFIWAAIGCANITKCNIETQFDIIRDNTIRLACEQAHWEKVILSTSEIGLCTVNCLSRLIIECGRKLKFEFTKFLLLMILRPNATHDVGHDWPYNVAYDNLTKRELISIVLN